MRQVQYAMQFQGRAEAAGEKMLRASTQCPSNQIVSTVGPDGVTTRIEPSDGGTAEFTSEVIFTSDTSFTETGTITFGEDNSLRFSTVGEGYAGSSPEEGLNHGSVMWRVDGGEGQFEGATGLITSNFTLSSDMEVIDHHFGVIWVR